MKRSRDQVPCAGARSLLDSGVRDYCWLIWPCMSAMGATKGEPSLFWRASLNAAVALLMASARAVLRSHAVSCGANLGELLTTMNVHLARDTGEERFVTLFYGVLDGADLSLVYASAGHDPVLWLQAPGGDIEELPNTGVPLGALSDSVYRQAGPVRLHVGDVLLIGTDGIWEARNGAGERLGRDRVRDILKASAALPAADVYNRILQAVRDFRGPAPQEDDITLVVIKMKEEMPEG